VAVSTAAHTEASPAPAGGGHGATAGGGHGAAARGSHGAAGAGGGHGVGLVTARHASRIFGRTAGRTIAIFVPVFFVATFATFLLRALSGLNPARIQLGQNATPLEINRLETSYGLNRPFFTQYWSWLAGVLHGNLGRSWSNGYPVSTLIRDGLTVSLTVATLALMLGVSFGLALGALAAVKRTTWIDRGITSVLSIVSTIPAFVIGIVLVEIVAVELRLLPSAGFVPFSMGFWPWLSHVLLPALALSAGCMSSVARQLRSGLIGAYRENYVIGATVRGLSPRRIFFRHVLRNGVGPAIAVLALEFPALIGGAVIVESIFALAGFGSFASTSAQMGDVPSVQGVLVVSIVLVVSFNLIVNLVLGRLSPAAQRGV
jgi:peptide/nickel transport system permease protein